MDADDHALVERVARAHEHAAAVLQVPQRVGDRLAVVLRDQHAVAAFGHDAGHRAVVVEHVAGEAGAAGEGEELALEADQAARGDAVFETDAALAVRLHVLQLAAAAAEFFHDRALVVFLDVYRHQFVGLAFRTVDLLEHHARAADGELETFAAHVLEQDGEVQFATARDLEHVRVLGEVHPQRDVLQQLLLEALADLAAGDELAFAAGEWRGVDDEVHRQRGFIHRDRLHAFQALGVAQRHADVHLRNAGDQHDVARLGRLGSRAFQPLEGEDLADLALAAVLVAVHHDEFLVGAHAAALDAADTELAHVGGVVERAHLHLQRAFRIHLGLRHVLEDGFEQRAHVVALVVELLDRETVEARGEDHREIELLFGGAELVEEIEGVVDDPVGAGARAVDLVDHDDRLETQRERLTGDEAGLRHRALDRVDQQQHAVDHRQHALDLAAEVGVARGVDDVDVGFAVLDRAVLGEDGDTALAFDVVRVHDPLVDLLVLAEGAGLTEQLVHQGGFAMVDVSDDGEVSNRAGHVGP